MAIEPIHAGSILNGRYEIQNILGQGGMGAVYLALDIQHRRHVAIKVARLEGLEARDQFRREASYLKRLHHHSLPRVWDYFSDTQRDFLVMEYIPGEDLEALVYRQGPQPEWLVLRWADELLDGLDYLHTQDPPIIHRDIKPGNLKLRTDETLVLVDFGIAIELDPNKGMEASALAVTPGFSPPEQYSDKPTDARTDIYSAGATLYFLLTGQIPPAAIDREEGRAQQDPPSRQETSVSPSTDMLVLKALNLSHEKRWDSATAMRHAVAYSSQKLAAKSPPDSAARRSPLVATSPTSGKRRITRRAVVALLLLIVAVGLSAAGLSALNSPEPFANSSTPENYSDQTATASNTPDTPAPTPQPATTPLVEPTEAVVAVIPTVQTLDASLESDNQVFFWQPVQTINEDFQVPKIDWPGGNRDGFNWGVQDGAYHLTIDQPNTLLSIPLGVSVGEFAASLSGRVLKGGNTVRFGIQFRVDDDSYYRLDYLPGAGLELSKQVNGVRSVLLERFAVPVDGSDKDVELGIQASDVRLQILFGKQLVAEINDNALKRGDISLIAISGPAGETEVTFSSFHLQPGSSEQIPLTIQPYEDPSGQFTLLTPDSWRQSIDSLGTSFDDLQHLARLVIIHVNDAQTDDPPQEVARKAVTQAAPLYPDFVVGPGKEVEINGKQAYEQLLHGQVLGVDVNARLVAMGENAPGYAAVAVVPVGEDAAMQPLMDYVLASFRTPAQTTEIPANDNTVASPFATSTPIPTNTGIPDPTPTKQATQATTATKAPLATSRPTTAATPRFPTATVSPTTLGGSYPVAVLQSPADGSSFDGPNAPIVFQWQSVGTLAPDDYYVLTVQFPHEGQMWQDVQWIKATSLAVPNYIYGASTLPGTLRWNVMVKHQTGTKPDGQKEGTEASPSSVTWSFEWVRGDSSGSGTSPAPDPTRPAPPTRVPTTRTR